MILVGTYAHSTKENSFFSFSCTKLYGFKVRAGFSLHVQQFAYNLIARSFYSLNYCIIQYGVDFLYSAFCSKEFYI